MKRRTFLKNAAGIFVPSLFIPKVLEAQTGGNVTEGGNSTLGGNVATIPPSGIVPALVNHGNNGSSPWTMGWTLTAGNAMIAAIRIGDTSASGVSVTDSEGNTWTPVTHQILATDGDMTWLFYTTGIVGGASNIVTVHPSGGTPTIIIVIGEFSGVAASPVDKFTSQNLASGNAPDSGASAASTQAIELIIGACATATAVQITAGSGYTMADPVASGKVGLEYKTVSVTGTQDAAFAVGSATESGTIVCGFKGA